MAASGEQEGKLATILKNTLKTTVSKSLAKIAIRWKLLLRLAKLIKDIEKIYSDKTSYFSGNDGIPGQCSKKCRLKECSGSACARGAIEPEVEVLCSKEQGLQCVKVEMEKNSCCRVIDAPADEAEVYATMDFPLLSANMTLITYVTEYKYLTYVELESYYKTACSHVLVLRLPQLQRVAPGSLIAIHQNDPSQPPAVLEGLVAALYRDVVLTIELPLSPGRCITYDVLQCAVVSAHYDHPNTDLIFGEEILNSTVPVVGELLNFLPGPKTDVLDELWFVEARMIAITIMGTQLCDFGVPHFKEYDATALKYINDLTSDANVVVEPCAGNSDVTRCFLDFVSARGAAHAVQSPDDKPIPRKNVDIYIPKCHASVRRNDFELKNLTATVENFTWNKGTGILTVSLKINDSFFQARSATLTAYRRGRQSARDQGYTTASYAPLLNINIPVKQGDGILVDWKALQRAFVSSSFPEPAWIDVDLRFKNCNNPAIAKVIKCLHENTDLVARHIFYEEGPSYFYMWLQKHLNFSLPVYCGHYQQHFPRY